MLYDLLNVASTNPKITGNLCKCVHNCSASITAPVFSLAPLFTGKYFGDRKNGQNRRPDLTPDR